MREWKKGRLGRSVVGTLLAGAALLMGALAFADRLAPPIAERIVAGLLPWPESRVEIGAISFHGLRGLTASDLRLLPDTTGDELRIDTLSLDYSLSELLRKTRRLRVARVVGLRVDAARDGAEWPWLSPWSGTARDTAVVDDDGPGLRIDHVEISGPGLLAREAAGDTVLRVEDIAVRGGLSLGGAPRIDIADASLRVALGPRGSPVEARGRLSLAAGTWTIESVEAVDAEGGRVSGGGTIGPSAATGPALDLRVESDRFHFGRLHPALATYVSANQAASIDATVGGTLRRPEVSARVDFEHAGRLSAESTLDLDGGSQLFDARLTLEGLDLDRISGGRAAVDPLSGTLSSRLDLAVPDSVDGRLDLDLSSIAGTQPLSAAGSVVFARGLGEIDLEAALAEFRGSVRGTLRPIGAPPTWDVVVASRAELPLPEFVRSREPDWTGPWNGTARLVGEGLTLADLAGTVSGRLDPVDPSPRAGPIVVAGRATGGVLSLEPRLELGGGQVTGRARVELANARSAWSLSDVAVRNFSIGSWLGPADPGTLDAMLNAAATGGGIRARMVIDTVRGGRLEGTTGDVTARVVGGRTDLSGQIRRDSTRVDIDQLAFTSAGPVGAEVTFANLDPSDVMVSLPEGGLTGHLSLDEALEGRLELAESTLGGDPILGAVDLHVVDRDVTFEARLEGNDQALTLIGSAATTSHPLRLQIDEGKMDNLDLSGWSGGRVPGGQINGSIDGSVSGEALDSATGSMRLTLDSTQVGPVVVDRGRVDLELREGHADLTAEGNGVGRTLDLRLAADVGPDGSWLGGGTFRLADSAFTAPDDTLALRIDFRSPASDAAGTGWSASALGSGPLIAFPLDTLLVDVGLVDGVMTLARLTVVGPDLQLRGQGALPLNRTGSRTADLSVRGSTNLLGTLLARTGHPGYRGRGGFSLHSTGPASQIRHELQVGVGGVRSRALEIDSAYVAAVVTSDSVAWLSSLTADVIEAGRRPILLAPGSSPVLLGLGFTGAPGEQGVTGFDLDLAWDRAEPSILKIVSFGALLDSRIWEMAEPSSIDWSDGLELTGLSVHSSDGGRLDLRGRAGRTGTQDLTVDVVSLPVQARAPEAEQALAGLLDLQLRLSGAADSPLLEAEGRIRGTEETSHELTLTGDWSPAGLDIRIENLQPAGGSLLVSGQVPVGLSFAGEDLMAGTGGAVDITVRASEFGLDVVGPLLEPKGLEKLQGLVNGEVAISGSTTDPELRGAIAATGVGVDVDQLGVELSAARLGLTFSGRRATLGESVIRSDHGGTVRLTGGVDLPELPDGTFDVEAEFDRFAVVHTRQAEARASGSLALGGRLSAPGVTGNLRLDDATYWLTQSGAPAGLEEVELTEADYRELERRFNVTRDEEAASLADATEVDLTVAVESEAWVRRSADPSIAVEVAGDVRVRKQPGEEFQFEGTVRAVPGRSEVEEFGRRFQIESGTATLDGPASSASLDAEAIYKPDGDVTITLNVHADSTGFELTLGSRPEMDRSDIVSYIAVGRRMSDVQQLDEISGDMAGLGADIALSRVTGEIEDLARRTLGLDVVEIRQDGLKGLTLVVGRYTTRRLFVGFEQPVVFDGGDNSGFGIDDTELDAEYRINDWLLANLSGSLSLARFFLGVRHAY